MRFNSMSGECGEWKRVLEPGYIDWNEAFAIG